ncbi:phosphotriesterase family protein [Aquibacillus albus]|uniref:Phosphotriesterase-related protein n=1 Tax=Aquibacillus albus TaxID=1168171 RepID=A0ABS2MVU7_9BACI|nr:hypothetical protein [Aquibacillus albus]MBM7569965.1 phosphotriesterase-related protein [Aquibacillus albus]
MMEMGIQTVLGQIDPKNLKHIQPHEHLMIEAGNASAVNPALCIDDIEKTIKEVDEFQANGGSLIVDAQPVGAGRVASSLVEISKKTGVHIVASTGFHKSMFYWPEHWIHACSSDQLYQLFLDELQQGMYRGNQFSLPIARVKAKAGMIKTAVGADGLTDYYIPKFEAAVEAAKETGAPIMVHIEKGSDPFEVIQFITGRGVPASRVILCHLDRTHHDYRLHEQIAEAGVYLEYDTIGRFNYHDDETEAHLILHMINKGHLNSLLLSLDTTRARLLTYDGEIGLSYLFTSFLPRLKKLGVPHESLKTLTLRNPSSALSMIKN